MWVRGWVVEVGIARSLSPLAAALSALLPGALVVGLQLDPATRVATKDEAASLVVHKDKN